MTYDPSQTSFKQSMISIVFTGIWLEASMHLLIVRRYGENKFKEYDWKNTYEEKLELLAVLIKNCLLACRGFAKLRKSLVHEKAHFDNDEIMMAQDEAENAHEILVGIHKHFPRQLG